MSPGRFRASASTALRRKWAPVSIPIGLLLVGLAFRVVGALPGWGTLLIVCGTIGGALTTYTVVSGVTKGPWTVSRSGPQTMPSGSGDPDSDITRCWALHSPSLPPGSSSLLDRHHRRTDWVVGLGGCCRHHDSAGYGMDGDC